MKLELKAKGIRVTKKLKTHVERQLRFAMGRFGDRVRRVRVHLTDINGPKGGDDIQCRIQTHLAPRGELVIRETRGDAFSAIVRASARASHSVSRHLARRHMRRRGR